MSIRTNKKQVDFSAVLEAPDRAAIVSIVVDKKVNSLKYEKATDWFSYFEELADLSCPTQETIDELAEIKASRDILVHSQGIANETYIRKSGSRARAQAGDRLEFPEAYHRKSWETITAAVREISEAAVRKLTKSSP